MSDSADRIRFDENFLWGAATSAYQIEGSPLADGAGPSNWHVFSHTPGSIFADQTGDVACDHYRRWADDVALMVRLGLNAYRFSISWSRILPEGKGRVNRKGLDFYGRLIDRLLESGIEPCITLYHWDLPAALDEQGGWLARESVGWFADYAAVLFRTFGDRVSMWATLNEPWVVSDAGYLHGVHPPGHRSPREVPLVSHHLLLAHGAAVQVFRGEARGKIGIVVNIEPKDAATTAPEDVAAKIRADAYMNRQYLDPLFKGSYPEQMMEIFGADWPDFPEQDLRLIQEPLDFLGINYYTRGVVRHDPGRPPVYEARARQPDALYTETSWEVRPQDLTRVLTWVRQNYGDIPLYITENGAAFADPPSAVDGRVADPLRVDYLRTHLHAAHEAIRQGVDLRGYFAWSLLDNFEWSHGYSKRFGIVHVDYETQERTLKDSARFYRSVIESHGAALETGSDPDD